MKIRAAIIIMLWVTLLVLMLEYPKQVCGAEVIALLVLPVVAWKFNFHKKF